jgi:pimeloyl-ACP methyl ester carboxylesterase
MWKSGCLILSLIGFFTLNVNCLLFSEKTNAPGNVEIPFVGQEGIAEGNDVELWYETFGDERDPALLLIMGCAGQGILWPQELCERLATEHFYVIRYDNRDTGYSSSVDYDKCPYSLLDMAQDAISLFDHLNILKAHVVGTSMGGSIAQLMAAYFPERVSSLTLIATTFDYTPIMNAVMGTPLEHSDLSEPTSTYINWFYSLIESLDKSGEEKFNIRLEGWKIANGSAVSFEISLYEELVSQTLKREAHPERGFNHFFAMRASLDQLKRIGLSINTPTLVIHGSQDPVLPIDHGRALAQMIAGAKLIEVEGMGHCFHSSFYPLLIENLKMHTRASLGT